MDRTFKFAFRKLDLTKDNEFQVPNTMQIMGVIVHEKDATGISNYKSGTAIFMEALPTEEEKAQLAEAQANQQAFFESMHQQGLDADETFEEETDESDA